MTTADDAKQRGSSVDWLALWILFCAWCVLSGWGLSLLGELNRAGMGLSGVLFACGLFVARRHLMRQEGWFHRGSFRRLAPRIWLLLAFLALIGGLVYHPDNYDYLTYRFPRVLNWCWEQKWYWIPTVNERMNYSGTGFEWLMVPLFVFFKTDRLFFLINFSSYLFLPGLVYSVFSGLGISRRLAWWWMWVLPCGYCFILQSAGTGNDSFQAVYLLASFHYLFRARTVAPVKNGTLSFLAIALLTGGKITNLPLVFPWLIALAFQRDYLWKRSGLTTLVAVLPISVVISFLPVALLNVRYTGDYAGDPDNFYKMKLSNPISGLMGNSLELAAANLAPPLWPGAIDWEPLLPSDLRERLKNDFPRFSIGSKEMQIEESAGVGAGVTLLAVLMFAWGIGVRMTHPWLVVPRKKTAVWIVGGVGVALFVCIVKVGGEATPRLIAAYYAPAIAAVMVAVSLDGRIVRRRLFKWTAVAAMLSAFPLVMLCPSRPLFPVQTVSDFMIRAHMPVALSERFDRIYTLYASRFDGMKELTVELPAGEDAVGLIQDGNTPESSLWRPFGARKLVEVTPEESIAEVKAKGLYTVVISRDALDNKHTNIADLTQKWSAHLVAEKSILLRYQRGPETWYVLRL